MTDESTWCADYIIVGAGSAGCVLAARLSEDANNKVVLIEAGGADTDPRIHIPIGFSRTMKDAGLNWGYQADPWLEAGGRRVDWPRGKVLGGSSAINGLVYVRGQAEDYDLWAQLGAYNWSYQDVLPYFRRAENQQRGEDHWHGVGGPLTVSDLRSRTRLDDAFVAAACESGLAYNEDINGERQEGVGFFQLTARQGRRVSAASAYLTPAVRRRRNLRLVTGAQARCVLVEGARAIGVEVERAGRIERFRARGEIVLAAGAIGSPLLLQRSGIGDGAHLRDIGVRVCVQSPEVGQNLQDHYAAPMVARVRGETFNERARGFGLFRELWRYARYRRGLLASGAASVVAFWRSRPECATPDVQLHFLPGSVDEASGKPSAFAGMTCAPCQLRPESRGVVAARSPDPRQPPSIKPNYLSTETDRATLLAGMRFVRGIFQAPALKPYHPTEETPGEGLRSDDELLDFARQHGMSVYHPVGTCRMGSDPRAVIDPCLRVRGVSGLRVADASIMPRLISGNTNAAAIMIGERAADFIRRAV